jgi:hypothetical protein
MALNFHSQLIIPVCIFHCIYHILHLPIYSVYLFKTTGLALYSVSGGIVNIFGGGSMDYSE